MLPEEFVDAELSTYQIQHPTYQLLYDAITSYLAAFDEIHRQPHNSIGFVAKVGERRLREIKDPTKRAEMKRRHNSYGLGKTHLQIAAAKELIRRGYTVVCVSDVALMDELSRARGYDDDGEELNRLLDTVIGAQVLVWDDLGKAKTSDFRLDMYYQIINERYRHRRPILFSTNEDAETLADKIGEATASRLFGMAKGRLYAVEGPDYRLMASELA